MEVFCCSENEVHAVKNWYKLAHFIVAKIRKSSFYKTRESSTLFPPEDIR
jgi:hypothetical protein